MDVQSEVQFLILNCFRSFCAVAEIVADFLKGIRKEAPMINGAMKEEKEEKKNFSKIFSIFCQA